MNKLFISKKALRADNISLAVQNSILSAQLNALVSQLTQYRINAKQCTCGASEPKGETVYPI